MSLIFSGIDVFLGGFGGLYIFLLVDLRGLVGFYLLEN